MNTDQIKGNWKQLVGKAKEKWGRLTDDDWKIVEGKRDQLIGKVQERYGIAREEAERQVADFERTRESASQRYALRPCRARLYQGTWRLPEAKWVRGGRLCAYAYTSWATKSYDAAAKSAIHSSILAAPYYRDHGSLAPEG